LARGWLIETVDYPEERALAAPARADDTQEFFVDIEVDILKDSCALALSRIDL